MKLAAIDVGLSGAFAWFSGDLLGQVAVTRKMPDSIQGMHNLITELDCDVFMIEQVNLRPEDLKDHSVWRKLKMIKNLHQLQTIIILAGKQYIMISPQSWQFAYKESIKGMVYDNRKRYFKAIAAKLFTKTKVTLCNADALMILFFAWRNYQGQTEWLQDKCHEIGVKLFD